jgi:hypothetical protein
MKAQVSSSTTRSTESPSPAKPDPIHFNRPRPERSVFEQGLAILLTSGDAAKAIKLLTDESIGNTPVGTQFAEVHRVSKILQIGGGLGDGLEAVTGSAAPLRNLRLRWSGIACCCLSRSGVVLLGKSGQRQQHEAQ